MSGPGSGTVLTVPWDLWKRVTSLAARFAGRSAVEPVLGHVHLVEIGGRLFCEATDRYTAGVAVAGESVVPPAGLDVTVPVAVLRALRRAVSKDDPGRRSRVVVLRYGCDDDQCSRPGCDVHPGNWGEVELSSASRAVKSMALRFVPLASYPDLRRLLRKAPPDRSGFPVRPGLLAKFAVGDQVATVDTPDVGLTVVQVGQGDFFGMVVRPQPYSSTYQGEPAGLRNLVGLYTGATGGAT